VLEMVGTRAAAPLARICLTPAHKRRGGSIYVYVMSLNFDALIRHAVRRSEFTLAKTRQNERGMILPH
jgi:hypothetical protein